jgi:hypothetical protein
MEVLPRPAEVRAARICTAWRLMLDALNHISQRGERVPHTRFAETYVAHGQSIAWIGCAELLVSRERLPVLGDRLSIVAPYICRDYIESAKDLSFTLGMLGVGMNHPTRFRIDSLRESANSFPVRVMLETMTLRILSHRKISCSLEPAKFSRREPCPSIAKVTSGRLGEPCPAGGP